MTNQDNHIKNKAWFDYFSKRLGSTQLTHAATRLDQLEYAVTLLGRILNDLPVRRDWLDPNVERSAKALLLRESNTGPLFFDTDISLGDYTGNRTQTYLRCAFCRSNPYLTSKPTLALSPN